MLCGKFAWTNQKQYRDLSSDTSSLCNFGAHFSDINLGENQWWRCGMSAVSQATMTAKDFKKVGYMCAKRVKMSSSDTEDNCQKPSYWTLHSFNFCHWPLMHCLLLQCLSLQNSYYPGYQRFSLRAVGIFGVGWRPTHLLTEKPKLC